MIHARAEAPLFFGLNRNDTQVVTARLFGLEPTSPPEPDEPDLPMAFVPCRACRELVPLQAVECPECGAPKPREVAS